MKGVGREMAAQMRERESHKAEDHASPTERARNLSINPARLTNATVDVDLVSEDSGPAGASMVAAAQEAARAGEALPGGIDPTLAQPESAARSARLQPTNSSDLNDLVKIQSKRRQRRASLEIQQTPAQKAAMRRWRKLDTSIQLGSALNVAAKGAAAERQDLKRLHRGTSMQKLISKTRPKLFEAEDKPKAPPTCIRGILHPRSKARRRWDFLLFGMLMYCAFSIPFRVGFDSMAVDGWLMFETVIDISFLMDIIVNFRTGYCLDEDNEDSRIELRPKEIAKHYLKGWFVIDIVSAFPSQFLTMASGDGETTAVNKLPRLMRIPRLVRMIRLMKLMRLVRLFRQEQQGIFSKLIESSGLPPAAMRAVRLAFLTVVLSHTLACGWYFCHVWLTMSTGDEMSWFDVYCGKAAHEEELEATDFDVWNMTLEEREAVGVLDPEICRSETDTRYVISLYWAVTTLTTMGYGDITPKGMIEYIYTIVVMLMGVSFYAYIASNVAIVLANMDEVGSEYRDNMEKLSEFMTRKRMTLPLRRRLRKYFHVYWKSRGRIGVYNDLDVVNLITLPALRNDVTTELFREITRQVPFLHDKDPKFIEMVAPKMTLLRIADGEYVVKEGERGTDLFFVVSGSVRCEYETDNNEQHVLITHEQGQYFGDVAMFLLERNITSFRSSHPDGDECELYMLTRRDLEVAMTGNVDVARDLNDIAQEKMSHMKRQIQLLSTSTPKELDGSPSWGRMKGGSPTAGESRGKSASFADGSSPGSPISPEAQLAELEEESMSEEELTADLVRSWGAVAEAPAASPEPEPEPEPVPEPEPDARGSSSSAGSENGGDGGGQEDILPGVPGTG